jgi:hypothetical protein
MTKDELRTMLKDEYDVDTTSKMNKGQLEEMLTEAVTADAGAGTEDACEAFGAFDGDSPDCTDCPAAEACNSASAKKEEEKVAKKAPKKAGPRTGVVRSVKSKYETFKDLEDDIRGVEAGSLCVAFDKLLLDGGTMDDFLALSKSFSEEKGVGFRNKKSIMVHFRDRGRQNGWVIDTTAEGVHQVVGVNNEDRRPRTDSKKYAEWKAARDAEKAERAEEEPEVTEEPVAETEATEEEPQMDLAVNA